MNFFEYIGNNLTYLFIVIGAIVLVVAASIFKYFILKKLKKSETADVEGKITEDEKTE